MAAKHPDERIIIYADPLQNFIIKYMASRSGMSASRFILNLVREEALTLDIPFPAPPGAGGDRHKDVPTKNYLAFKDADQIIVEPYNNTNAARALAEGSDTWQMHTVNGIEVEVFVLKSISTIEELSQVRALVKALEEKDV